MSKQLATTFRDGIALARAKMQPVSEGAAHAQLKPGGWTLKQILGHLIDSALNNHQRFVRAALDGNYMGPTYAQTGWVDLHGYAELPFAELLNHWQTQNDLLCAVVDRIPADKLGVHCQVGIEPPATLRFLIEDYLVHLHHHADQIASGAGPERLFLQYSIEKMEQMTTQIATCVKQLSDDQIWLRSGDNANAVGNLLLHLAGNIRQWIGHGVGGLADVRERDKEFAARGERSTAEVLSLFESTVSAAVQTLRQLPASRLAERIKPQNREVAVLEAIYQVVGHLQLHAGQIIFATKQITGKDLQFFRP